MQIFLEGKERERDRRERERERERRNPGGQNSYTLLVNAEKLANKPSLLYPHSLKVKCILGVLWSPFFECTSIAGWIGRDFIPTWSFLDDERSSGSFSSPYKFRLMTFRWPMRTFSFTFPISFPRPSHLSTSGYVRKLPNGLRNLL